MAAFVKYLLLESITIMKIKGKEVVLEKFGQGVSLYEAFGAYVLFLSYSSTTSGGMRWLLIL